jgi:hypothetical protein
VDRANLSYNLEDWPGSIEDEITPIYGVRNGEANYIGISLTEMDGDVEPYDRRSGAAGDEGGYEHRHRRPFGVPGGQSPMPHEGAVKEYEGREEHERN